MGEDECAEWNVLFLIIIFMPFAYRIMERRTEKGDWIYSRERHLKMQNEQVQRSSTIVILILIIWVPYYLRSKTLDVAFPFPSHDHYPLSGPKPRKREALIRIGKLNMEPKGKRING